MQASQSNGSQFCQRTHKAQRTREKHHHRKKTTRKAVAAVFSINLPVDQGEPTHNCMNLVDNYNSPPRHPIST
ncbi:hypothetical protein EMPG_14419 [Blastomyces silverae]|uniref:Uncharacterized protein n=1 Tax=Blastomyces silverae TaxID=2060906 RepID=A0A0H1BGM9_9EURO|nr:hypothetical protein EMPG_14419 [Blastomyces silverae]